MLEKAKAIQQQLIGQGPGDFAKRERLAEMTNALGFVYFKRIDYPAAFRCFQQVQEICVSLMSEITDGPTPVKLLSLLALSHYNVATMHVIDKHLDKALQSFEKVARVPSRPGRRPSVGERVPREPRRQLSRGRHPGATGRTH